MVTTLTPPIVQDSRDPQGAPDAHGSPHSHSSRGRGAFNAWFFDTFDRYLNFILRPLKSAAFAGIEPGQILEIGAGTGANLAYLPIGSRVIALEPNLAMHERLRRRCAEQGIDMKLLVAPGETIPLEDNSVDTVICSLVLCTVENPAAVLQEIRRVLKPGGTFRFVEHVVANPMSPRRWLQRSISWPWAWVFEGCQLCRSTGDAISRAGFSLVSMKRHRIRFSAFIPVNTAIYGVATQWEPQS